MCSMLEKCKLSAEMDRAKSVYSCYDFKGSFEGTLYLSRLVALLRQKGRYSAELHVIASPMPSSFLCELRWTYAKLLFRHG